VGFAEDQPVVGARYRYLTSRDKNKLSATQAQACIAAAILRQLHAIMVTGQKWDPVIAAGGRPTAEPTLVAA
jgi:hypothetical protein